MKGMRKCDPNWVGTQWGTKFWKNKREDIYEKYALLKKLR